MIDKSKKLEILEEILKSKSFCNSKLNSKLLHYLVNCEIENKNPSEYSIAIDVFNKNSNFNPNEDTLVRVSVYNLRKKLEKYYQNMGKRTKHRVKIPKGHYEVEFFNYSKENLRNKISNPILLLILLVFILLIIISYLVTMIPGEEKVKNNVLNSTFADNLFSDFTKSSNPKLLALGDDFIYYSDFSEFKTTSIRKMFRNSTINTEEEFEKFKSDDINREALKKLPFSFFNQAAVWPLPYLVKVLHDYDISYITKSASTLNLNDVKANDIIFLGSFWTLGILDQVIKDLGISYNIIGNEILQIRDDADKDSIVTYHRTGVPAFEHIDYCTFIKIPGPDKTTIFLLASFYATGSVGAINFLTKEKTLQELKVRLEKEFKNIPDNFLVVFKATGYNREVLSTEIVQLKQISPELINW